MPCLMHHAIRFKRPVWYRVQKRQCGIGCKETVWYRVQKRSLLRHGITCTLRHGMTCSYLRFSDTVLCINPKP